MAESKTVGEVGAGLLVYAAGGTQESGRRGVGGRGDREERVRGNSGHSHSNRATVHLSVPQRRY